MRVALLSCNARAGDAIGNQVAEKLALFVERGADVRVFLESLACLHPQVAAHAEVLHPEPTGDAWEFLAGADLICVEFGHYYTLLNLLPLLVGRKPRILIDYHGVTPPDLWGQHNREGLEKGRAYRGLAWCADRTIVHSHSAERDLIDATGISEERIVRLGLPVDPEQFFPAPTTRTEDATVLLYVGRLAPNKRVPLLIDALARLSDIEPPVHLRIVGDIGDLYQTEAERCRRRARDLGVEERVHFLGPLLGTPLRQAYQSADAFVLPSAWESFSVPVVEAMACGVPVIAARAYALPETIGDAGLTFTLDDAEDLAQQVRRVLARTTADGASRNGKHRLAVVSFRFGATIVGGAETSLRTMAQALAGTGHHVEVFTTCTNSESNWKNDLPAGTTAIAGLTVHRFPIEPHDLAAHGEIVRTILDADGHVAADLSERYLRHSIHSSALLEALRKGEFDAIITGPYLFGLTADIVREFGAKVLLVPCFHDEAFARLPIWPGLSSNAGGILYHSVEEQAYAQIELGVNHPNTAIIGTCLPSSSAYSVVCASNAQSDGRPYVVYCGRYSGQKNVPLLLEWGRRYQTQNPQRLDFVFMGQGDVQLPREPWLRDLGCVEEKVKRAVMAEAKALVQLSRYESLSLVALEAWSEGTPVIAHRDCAVLVGQIERSRGGAVIGDYNAFARTLDDLLADQAAWRKRGAAGRANVEANYLSATSFANKLLHCLDQLQKPLRQQMCERGLERAREFARANWQRRFAELVEDALTQPAAPYREELHVEPLRSAWRVGPGAGTSLLPVRLRNGGTHAALAEGPGRTVLCCDIRARDGERIVMGRADTVLPGLLAPGHSQSAAVPVALPAKAGAYRIRLWAERLGAVQVAPRLAVEVPLVVEAEHTDSSASCVSTFLDTVAETLPEAHQLQQLPADYVDVTEGQLAPVKRFIKRKLLHNFKHAYVDVLSRQQSQVNGHLVSMIQQLAECCALLDHAVTGLHQRMDQLEARLERNMSAPEQTDRTLADRPIAE